MAISEGTSFWDAVPWRGGLGLATSSAIGAGEVPPGACSQTPRQCVQAAGAIKQTPVYRQCRSSASSPGPRGGIWEQHGSGLADSSEQGAFGACLELEIWELAARARHCIATAWRRRVTGLVAVAALAPPNPGGICPIKCIHVRIRTTPWQRS